MPLRTRLIVLIGMVLLLSLGCGSVLVGWRAANSVRTELRAALDMGARTIRNGLGETARADDRAEAARQLVATFNGNRHVRATLLDQAGRLVLASELLEPVQPAPLWFRDLIGGESGAVRVPVAGDSGGAIVLHADPGNEVGEVWAESRDAMAVLAGFAALSALLIAVVVQRALRPIETFLAAFDRIGDGQYHGHLDPRGTPEVMRLATGFNVMTSRLATAAAQNHRLHERLLTLQAEERADLARDLHDEIGPLLFAVDMTAATIEQLAGTGGTTEIASHAQAIKDAVGRMQRHVRMLLGRLRPIQAIGLEAAIERLAAFWRVRRPDITFLVSVSVEEDRVDDDLREAIYRVAQEGTSNAIRHGKPARISIVVAHDAAAGIRVEVTDDGIGMAVDGGVRRDPGQLGLIGMRERVMSMAGSLSIQGGGDGKGLKVTATLPCEKSPPAPNSTGEE